MPQSEKTRLSAVVHVVYDYVNLVSAGELVQTALPPRVNSHVQHAFLMSCRVIGDFFEGRGKPDDMKASDFLRKRCKFSLPTWKSWRDHMNRQHLHLTYSRVRNQRQWVGGPVNQQFLQEMRACWQQFLSKLEEPFFSEFEAQISQKERSEFSACKLR